MSDLEFVGKMNPKPFVSIRKDEEMRIEEIKKRILKKELDPTPEPELTYERDAQEN